MAPTFLITGATGSQGGATARILSQNATVHALVRNTKSPASQSLQKAGAILFQGDFDDTIAIKAATASVSGIFLNSFPTADPELQVRQAHNFIDAALASKTVETIVLSTAFFTGSRDIWGFTDPHLGLQVYYGRKAAMEDANYILPQSVQHFPELSSEGVLAHVYGKVTRMPHLDAADVGKFAAVALLEPEKFRGEEIELGNEKLTLEEAAGILRKISSVEIGVRKSSEEEVRRVWNSVPTLKFRVLANEKHIGIDGKALEEKYGIRLTSFEGFLEREKEVLMKSIPRQK